MLDQGIASNTKRVFCRLFPIPWGLLALQKYHNAARQLQSPAPPLMNDLDRSVQSLDAFDESVVPLYSCRLAVPGSL